MPKSLKNKSLKSDFLMFLPSINSSDKFPSLYDKTAGTETPDFLAIYRAICSLFRLLRTECLRTNFLFPVLWRITELDSPPASLTGKNCFWLVDTQSIQRIKKISSPKIKIWFEPMFFYGFFCGFERCGSAAFPNFRGGNFSEKCVRTIFRILHHVGNCKRFWFASLRSATSLYSILGVKTNSRFRILGEENFLILNPKTI